jgi:hypothetical protein
MGRIPEKFTANIELQFEYTGMVLSGQVMKIHASGANAVRSSWAVVLGIK